MKILLVFLKQNSKNSPSVWEWESFLLFVFFLGLSCEMIGDGAQQDPSRMNKFDSVAKHNTFAIQSIENGLFMLCWNSKNHPHQAQIGPQKENYPVKVLPFSSSFFAPKENLSPFLLI